MKQVDVGTRYEAVETVRAILDGKFRKIQLRRDFLVSQALRYKSDQLHLTQSQIRLAINTKAPIPRVPLPRPT